MIMDKQLEFSDSQAVTGTAVSTNVIDMGDDVPTRNIGGFGAASLVVQVDTAFAGLTSVTVEIVSDSDPALSSPTVHASTGAIAVADLTPGTIAVMPLPVGDYERYVGLRYTVAGTGTAGAISAFITNQPQVWRAVSANNPPAN